MRVLGHGIYKTEDGKLAAHARVYADVATMRADDGVVAVTHAMVPGASGGRFYWTTDTSTADDGAIVVAKASGRTGAWKRQFDGLIDVRWFGAKFDGVTNDAGPIKAALDWAIANDARVVLMPPGTAIIQPAAINTGYAVEISGSHIELRGSGRTQTKLKFRLYDGSDPATHWPIVAGAVMRGNAIRVAGGSSYVRISNLEIDGGAGYTGNYQFPASVVNGDGWDLTHKAVYLQENTTLDNIEVVDCDLHSFRGELVFYGGSGLTNLRIVRNKAHDTNGDGLSFTAEDLEVEQNEVYRCAGNGIEDNYLGGYGHYHNNNVHDCGLQGIAVFPVHAASTGFVDIIKNRVANCSNPAVQPSGIWIAGARNMRVLDNLIVDCVRGITVGFGGEFGDSDIDNVLIRDNTVVADTTDVDSVVFLSTTNPRGLRIYDNYGIVSAAGLLAGKQVRRSININENGAGTFGAGCIIRNNPILNGVQDNDANAIARNVALTTTAFNTFATAYTRFNPGFFHVKVFWQVTNTTDLLIRVDWLDADGVSQTHTLLTGSQSAGFGSATWSAVTGPNAAISVNAQASVANRVKVSAKIEVEA